MSNRRCAPFQPIDGRPAFVPVISFLPPGNRVVSSPAQRPQTRAPTQKRDARFHGRLPMNPSEPPSPPRDSKYSSPVMARKSEDDSKTSRYEDSDNAVSKGIVSSLVSLVNSLSFRKSNAQPSDVISPNAPNSPQELMERISLEYTAKNYLWSGDLDIDCFEPSCRFTDPTLSFVGTDQFVRNIRNLRPFVDALTTPGGTQSDLLDVQLNEEEGFVETRWNMVGSLSGIPWKPRVDVIGRTKFWFREQSGKFRVKFYDEEWEIPAGRALLQLVTPPGTIGNTTRTKEE